MEGSGRLLSNFPLYKFGDFANFAVNKKGDFVDGDIPIERKIKDGR